MQAQFIKYVREFFVICKLEQLNVNLGPLHDGFIAGEIFLFKSLKSAIGLTVLPWFHVPAIWKTARAEVGQALRIRANKFLAASHRPRCYSYHGESNAHGQCYFRIDDDDDDDDDASSI